MKRIFVCLKWRPELITCTYDRRNNRWPEFIFEAHYETGGKYVEGFFELSVFTVAGHFFH